MRKNIVIGIEGLVGCGKTSICRKLLNEIPNSILLHGGNIYRAVVYRVMESGIDLKNIQKALKNIDIKELMEKLKIEIRLHNRETVIYIDGKEIDEERLQSEKSSIAVSMVSQIADNRGLYAFGKSLIDEFREKYNIILSSRDIMKMYPEVNYHFLITASLEERVKRKCIQYKGKALEQDIRKNIIQRDKLQDQSGYYNTYDITQKIDVTDCKTVEESTNRVLQYIKIPVEI